MPQLEVQGPDLAETLVAVGSAEALRVLVAGVAQFLHGLGADGCVRANSLAAATALAL